MTRDMKNRAVSAESIGLGVFAKATKSKELAIGKIKIIT